MRLVVCLCIVKAMGYISLDNTETADIFSLSTVYMIKTSNPGTGFVWYLLSEDESKVTVSDADGIYTSGTPGYQNFTVVCTDRCNIGDNLKLSLILKRPWEDYLFIIKTIDMTVLEKTL